MPDPWASFRLPPQAPVNDPWQAFRVSPMASPAEPQIAPMGADGVSGDELRMRNAGNTRAQMRPQDIESAYNVAQARGDRPEQQAMAEAFVRREKADSPIAMGLGDTVRQIARGVPVLGGMADEANATISGGLGYLMGGNYAPAYERALDYQRARDSVFEKDNPATSFGLQLGGGVASGMGAASKIAPMVGNMSRAAILGTGLGGGAALGAADGFTRGDTPVDRGLQAGLGGIVGGAAGLAAPVIAKGVTATGQRLADALTTNRQLSGMGLDRPSADVLARALMADNTLGERGAANIAAAGPRAMLADAGPTAAAILDTTIQRGGPGASIASQAINERATVAGQQIDDALNSALGRPRESAARDLVVYGDRTNPLSLIYREAYETPINYGSAGGRKLESLVATRVPGSVIEKANNLMRIEGAESQQILARIADDGRVTFEKMPDVRQLDYITRALNDVAKAGDGKGALGGNTAEGRAYGNLSREIRSSLRELVPAYGRALDRASDEIGKVDALKFGGGLLSRSVTREEVAEEVAGMSAAQLRKVKEGVRNHIDEVIANVRKTVSDPNLDGRQSVQALRDLSSDAAREKVGAVVGPGEAQRLFGQLDEAARAFELRAATANNSKTFARTVTNEAIRDVTEPGPAGRLMEGKPIQASRALVQALLGTGPHAKVAREDQIYGRLAQALTGPRGMDAQNLSLGLEDAYRRRATNQRLAEILGATSAGGLSSGLYLSGGQAIGRKQ